MNADQAKFLATYLTGLWEGEFPATCKVLAAVPESGRDYRPDEKSRCGWELTVHLATSDIWFADGVISGSYLFDAETEKAALGRFRTLPEVVDYYKREFPVRMLRIREMRAEDLVKVVDFFGFMQAPNVTFLGMANNHSVHHRGQLAAYLRAMGSKVPAIYGISADEQMPATASS
jgi:uncharacterized damage-inducible protein DinB